MKMQPSPPRLDEVRTNAIHLWEQGDTHAAAALLTDFLHTDTGDALAWNDLGVLLFSEGDHAGAERSFCRALHLDSSLPAALRGYGECLLRRHCYREAINPFARFLTLDPENSGAILSLIQCLCESGRLSEALELAESAPQSARLHGLIAQIYRERQLPGKALSSIQKAAELAPDDLEIRVQHTLALWEFGRTEEAISACRVLMTAADIPRPLRSLLVCLALHHPDQTVEQAAKGDRGRSAPAVLRSRKRPLRVGFISGEKKKSPTQSFVAPWLRHLSHWKFHSTVYGDHPHFCSSGMSAEWRDISRRSNRQVADLVRNDDIDILVDLSGYYGGDRLEVFRQCPAPVQVAFPNYPGTTALEEMDYILTDRWTTPPGSEGEYAETPYRLPYGYSVYEPPCHLPALGPCPHIANGFPTFGLFQRPGKYYAAFWDIIAQILGRLPEARLLIHFSSEELELAESEQRDYLSGLLKVRGIATSRLAFAGSPSMQDHLRVVSQVDIALDAFPYNGQTTTCDCLWMGVPVITLRGNTHVSRVGAALLDRMQLPELAAISQTSYVETAVNLAINPHRLSELRASLRVDAQQRLGDGNRLAREIAEACEWMWQR